MSGPGFGICGHRNHYSSYVRHGNWVEDKIGVDLANSHQMNAHTMESKTEASSQFVHPAQQVAKGPPGPAAEPDMTLRKGLPAATLFKHGFDSIPKHNMPMTEAGSERMRKRAAALEAERLRTTLRSTESREYGGHQDKIVYKVKDPSKPVQFPNFHRCSSFSHEEKMGR